MRDVVYLICTKSGVERLRKTVPLLKRGEVAIKVSVEVDDELFKQPIVETELKAEEKHIIKGQASVQANEVSEEEHEAADIKAVEATLEELVAQGLLKREFDPKTQRIYYVRAVEGEQ